MWNWNAPWKTFISAFGEKVSEVVQVELKSLWSELDSNVKLSACLSPWGCCCCGELKVHSANLMRKVFIIRDPCLYDRCVVTSAVGESSMSCNWVQQSELLKESLQLLCVLVILKCQVIENKRMNSPYLVYCSVFQSNVSFHPSFILLIICMHEDLFQSIDLVTLT